MEATMTIEERLARCDREIAEASTHVNAPAWLVALGVNDWSRERDLIEQEREGK